jgi:hypothetical protein
MVMSMPAKSDETTRFPSNHRMKVRFFSAVIPE